MSGPDDVWARFALDPRDPAHAGLRASDADRELLHGVLADAYGEGRLDPAELDERSSRVLETRVLGDLPPLVADLVPVSPVVRRPATASPDLHERAVQKWRDDVREAIFAFVGPSLICWVIWVATMLGGFPWPLFVMLGTGLHLLRTTTSRRSIVEEHERRLLKRQRKELGG